jgi:hypothetical protein
MIKLCLVAALGCVLGLPSVAPAEQTASAVMGGTAKLKRAEAASRLATAPLPAERVLCMHRSRRTSLCFVLHEATGPRQCRSVVVVGKVRTRVAIHNVCFEFTEVQP